jgi:hypothetical protein
VDSWNIYAGCRETTSDGTFLNRANYNIEKEVRGAAKNLPSFTHAAKKYLI